MVCLQRVTAGTSTSAVHPPSPHHHTHTETCTNASSKQKNTSAWGWTEASPHLRYTSILVGSWRWCLDRMNRRYCASSETWWTHRAWGGSRRWTFRPPPRWTVWPRRSPSCVATCKEQSLCAMSSSWATPLVMWVLAVNRRENSVWITTCY